MHTYARIQNGVVMEIIGPMADGEGNEIPITERYVATLIDGTVSSTVDVTGVTPQPECWWTYSNGNFLPPNPVTASAS